ncbi:MAG: carbohydrate binding family 9 domain-containing protein, partial [Bacteroidales bacterium]|nr:carbohydrate binding family 9 domain-containing protein [Bacteroidales bacterium]
MRKFIKPILLLLLGLLCFSGNLFSQEKRKYTTTRIQGNAPRIDGHLDDAAWNQVEWENDFTQYQPFNGGIASQQTAFKILYDNNFLYIAVRAFDSIPSDIVNRMSRRDGFQGDWVEIAFDSYHDYSTGYSFTASVAGVKNDELYTNDGSGHDRTWDPIWYLKTSIDKEGWIAEIKIPFTQLRFSEEENQVWGLQVKRFVYRKEERSLWQHVSNEQAGYVSRWGELHG